MEQQNTNQQAKDYILSLYEVCEVLGKSSRTVSRYVHRNILHPVGIKSRQGTLEYRFSQAEIEAFKQREDEIRQFNYMTQMPNSRPGMATFASVNYQRSQAIPRSAFTIPGISFPIVPSQAPSSQPVAPIQSYQKEPEQAASVPDNGHIENTASEPVDQPAARIEALHEAAPIFQDHSNEQIIVLLKETTEMLRDQLQVKDGQIKNLDEKIGQLIERNRETNILLKGLQDKMVLLEKPKNERKIQTRTEAPATHSEDVAPMSSPPPKVADSAMGQVKIKIAQDCGVSEIQDNEQPKNNAEIQGRAAVKSNQGSRQEVPSRNDGQPARGFFGKIFG
jgi:hypothetical protein